MIVKLSLLTLSHMRVHARVCGRYFVYSWHVASCARAGQSRSTVRAESGESGRSSGTSRRRSRQGKVVVGTDTVFFLVYCHYFPRSLCRCFSFTQGSVQRILAKPWHQSAAAHHSADSVPLMTQNRITLHQQTTSTLLLSTFCREIFFAALLS